MRWKVNVFGKVKMRPWAQCQDESCDWSSPEGSTTRDKAKHHVAVHGHEVLVVIEDRTLYEPAGDGFD